MPVELVETDSEAFEGNGAKEPAVAVVNGVTYVVVPNNSPNDPGVRVYSVAADGSMTLVHTVADTSALNYASSAIVNVIGGVTYVYIGSQVHGISTYTLDASGVLTPAGSLLPLPSYELDLVVSEGATYLVSNHGNVTTLIAVDGSGGLTPLNSISDDGTVSLRGNGQAVALSIGGVGYLVARSAEGVSVFAIESGALALKTSIGAFGGNPLTTSATTAPLTVATVGGVNYVITRQGAALVVFSVGTGGTLTEVGSTPGTGGTPDFFYAFMETVQVGGKTYIIASQGSEHAVYQLGADGSLTLESLTSAGGDYALAIVSFQIGGTTFILDTGAVSPTVYRVDPGINIITGTPKIDNLVGTAGVDQIDALAGNDKVSAGDGGDTVNGGDGNDVIYGDGGDDTLNGDAGNDKIWGGEGADQVNGGDGDDILEGDAGDDVMRGGIGKDTMSGGTGNDELFGEDGDDKLQGGDGDDTLQGGAGADRLEGGAGNDKFYGGAGNDTMIGGAGDDTYYDVEAGDVITEGGGGGTDTVETSAATYTLGVNIENLVLLNGAVNGTGNKSNNQIEGNAAANVLLGLDGDDMIWGGEGDDTLLGGNGNDDLGGGDGRDTLQGDAGDDWLDGHGDDDTLIGGAGNDFMIGGDGADTLNGGDGNDTLIGGGSKKLRGPGGGDDGEVDILRGGAGNDTYLAVGAEDIVVELANGGTDTVHALFDYVLGANLENLDLRDGEAVNGTGNALANIIYGNSEDNVLKGLDGDDTLHGDSGADTLEGGAGNDTYYADDLDTIVETENGGVDHVYASTNFTLGAFLENLTLGDGVEFGGGNDLANKIVATTGATLDGAGGNDTLVGSAWADTLIGGGGNDKMTGGLGADTFIIDGAGIALTSKKGAIQADTITDFDFASGDTILLTLDANANVDGHQDLALVSRFSKTAGEATLTYSSAKNTTTLLVDVDGDGKADYSLTVNGNHTGGTPGALPDGWLLGAV